MKISWAIAVTLMLGSMSCVVEMADESAVAQDDVSRELATEEQEAGDGQTLAAGVYRFVSRESCRDVFTRPCSSSVPTNQCPSAAPGAACSPVPHSCWKVISSSTVDTYRCVAP